MRLRISSWLIGFPLLLLFLLSSCSGAPHARKQKYFQTGQRYFEKGKYSEAAIEFMNAIKVDPNYADAHHQLAESYLRLQKPEGAFQELGRTLERRCIGQHRKARRPAALIRCRQQWRIEVGTDQPF